MKFLLLLIITSVSILPQESKIEVLSNSHLIYPYQNGKIFTSDKSFDVYEGETKIFSQAIDGKKIIYNSYNGSYILVANYEFKASKEDYMVDYFMFDKSFTLKKKFSEIAPFDLPHSLASISDDGFFALFDPLSYNLKIIDENGINEISLKKDISFEMERTTFIRCYANKIAIAVNEIAMNNSEAEAGIDFFIINKNTNEISASNLKLSILTGLHIDKERVFVSGVIWNNSLVSGKTFIYKATSEELINSVDYNFDNIIKTNGGYATAIGNQIQKISEDGNIKNKTVIKSNRIYNIASVADKLCLTYAVETGNYLLILNEESLLPISDPSFISDKQMSNRLTITNANELFLQDVNSTFIYRMK
jgi:hypothetical protein